MYLARFAARTWALCFSGSDLVTMVCPFVYCSSSCCVLPVYRGLGHVHHNTACRELTFTQGSVRRARGEFLTLLGKH